MAEPEPDAGVGFVRRHYREIYSRPRCADFEIWIGRNVAPKREPRPPANGGIHQCDPDLDPAEHAAWNPDSVARRVSARERRAERNVIPASDRTGLYLGPATGSERVHGGCRRGSGPRRAAMPCSGA